MSTTTFPNGTTLTSSALSFSAFNIALQALACQMLGIDTVADPLAFYKVRVGWMQQGQPAFLIDEDICTVMATIADDPYNRIRNKTYSPNDSQSLTETTEYTRVWRVTLSFYGPNSGDNARLVKSALFLDWTHNALAQSNLYLITDIADPTRAPEEFEGQWWERSDLTIRLNENVIETVTTPTVASTEVIIETARGIAADLTIT